MKIIRQLGALALLTSLFTVSSGASAAPIGYSITSDDDLVSIDLATGAATTIGALGISGDYEGLAFNSFGQLFASNDITDTIYSVNNTTGAATALGASGINWNNSGMSFSASDTLFLSAESTASLYTINTTTGAGTLVGNYGSAVDMTAIAFVGNTLYGIDDASASLVTIDTSTAALTTVGALGISGFGGQPGLDYDSASNTMYMLSETPGRIFTINLTTGAATAGASLSGFESLAINDGPQGVPEPATALIFSLALAGLGYFRPRRTH